MTTSTVSSLALVGCVLAAAAGCGRGETKSDPAPAAPPPAAPARLDPEQKFRERVAELERDREELLAALLVATGTGVRCGRAVAVGGAELIVFLPAGPRGLAIGHGLDAEPDGGRYLVWARSGDAAWQPLGELRPGLGLAGHRLVFLREPGEPAPEELALSLEREARPAAMSGAIVTVAVGDGCP